MSRQIKLRKPITEVNKMEVKLSKVFKVNKSFINNLMQNLVMWINSFHQVHWAMAQAISLKCVCVNKELQLL